MTSVGHPISKAHPGMLDGEKGNTSVCASRYSRALVGGGRLAMVDVPVREGVGHRGAPPAPSCKVLQQISREKRHAEVLGVLQTPG